MQTQRDRFITLFETANHESLSEAYKTYNKIVSFNHIDKIFNQKELADVYFNLARCYLHQATQYYDSGKYHNAHSPEDLLEDIEYKNTTEKALEFGELSEDTALISLRKYGDYFAAEPTSHTEQEKNRIFEIMEELVRTSGNLVEDAQVILSYINNSEQSSWRP